MTISGLFRISSQKLGRSKRGIGEQNERMFEPARGNTKSLFASNFSSPFAIFLVHLAYCYCSYSYSLLLLRSLCCNLKWKIWRQRTAICSRSTIRPQANLSINSTNSKRNTTSACWFWPRPKRSSACCDERATGPRPKPTSISKHTLLINNNIKCVQFPHRHRFRRMWINCWVVTRTWATMSTMNSNKTTWPTILLIPTHRRRTTPNISISSRTTRIETSRWLVRCSKAWLVTTVLTIPICKLISSRNN